MTIDVLPTLAAGGGGITSVHSRSAGTSADTAGEPGAPRDALYFWYRRGLGDAFGRRVLHFRTATAMEGRSRGTTASRASTTTPSGPSSSCTTSRTIPRTTDASDAHPGMKRLLAMADAKRASLGDGLPTATRSPGPEPVETRPRVPSPADGVQCHRGTLVVLRTGPQVHRASCRATVLPPACRLIAARHPTVPDTAPKRGATLPPGGTEGRSTAGREFAPAS